MMDKKEIECSSCDGRGYFLPTFYAKMGPIKCDDCDGKGTVETDQNSENEEKT